MVSPLLDALSARAAHVELPLADLLDPSRGPSESGDFSVDPTAFIVLMLLGFLIGVGGHIVKSKVMVAAGILMIFLASLDPQQLLAVVPLIKRL